MSPYGPADAEDDPTPEPSPIPTVAVAGASGFVGRGLARALAPDHRVIGLGRHPADIPGVTWRRCDLFSLLDAETALEDVEVGVYLVHSMLPTSRLTQARFQDLDLICADNFARAARRRGLRRIVYLGGLIPPGPDEDLSAHLRSRLEVERTLAAHGVPLVALRASIVIGAGGSSFEMMARLVERLPGMILPAWTASKTQPIAHADLIRLLAYAVDDATLPAGVYDVGGPDVVSYQELMAMTARQLGLRRFMLPVPLFSPGLSRAWVTLFTGAPHALVSPLVQSLRHPMVAADRRLQERARLPGTPLRAALAEALVERARHAATVGETAAATPERHPWRRLVKPAGDVRSVQRLALPPGYDAYTVADEYLRWLPRHLRGLLSVEVTRADEDRASPPVLARIRIRPLRRPVLELRFSPERSSPDRPLFYVTGGLLAPRDPSRGRLEFREVGDGRTVLAALHDYVPRLPFGVYVVTQGLIHRLVMSAFARYLQAKAGGAGAVPVLLGRPLTGSMPGPPPGHTARA
jgi:uncharacterized protein YbjT (DUF2867 family)